MQMAEEDSDITSSLISEVDREEVGHASSRFTGATRLGTVERLNLINLAKLCIKRVIEFTSTQGMSIDDFSPQIQELFILLESCMRHRLKGEWACPRQVAWRVQYVTGHIWFALTPSANPPLPPYPTVYIIYSPSCGMRCAGVGGEVCWCGDEVFQCGGEVCWWRGEVFQCGGEVCWWRGEVC